MSENLTKVVVVFIFVAIAAIVPTLVAVRQHMKTKRLKGRAEGIILGFREDNPADMFENTYHRTMRPEVHFKINGREYICSPRNFSKPCLYRLNQVVSVCYSETNPDINCIKHDRALVIFCFIFYSVTILFAMLGIFLAVQLGVL